MQASSSPRHGRNQLVSELESKQNNIESETQMPSLPTKVRRPPPPKRFTPERRLRQRVKNRRAARENKKRVPNQREEPSSPQRSPKVAPPEFTPPPPSSHQLQFSKYDDARALSQDPGTRFMLQKASKS